MKNIIYSIIAVFIFSMSAVSFTSKNKSTTSVVIQSVDQKISPVDLSKSVQVISDRLKSFSSEKFDITPMPKKNQIKISFSGKWDLDTAVGLLVQKGEMRFYECFDRDELSTLLHGDNHLFSFFKNVGQQSKIGCTSIQNSKKVDDYIRNLGLSGQCKFLWSESKDSETCLYALKVRDGQGTLLSGEDVEEVRAAKDKTSGNYSIEIRFRKSAVSTWADATRRNINKPIAIVLDDKIVYAPVLRSEIKEGLCSITGNFTETDVSYFAALGNNGVLPVDFKVLNRE